MIFQVDYKIDVDIPDFLIFDEFHCRELVDHGQSDFWTYLLFSRCILEPLDSSPWR